MTVAQAAFAKPCPWNVEAIDDRPWYLVNRKPQLSLL